MRYTSGSSEGGFIMGTLRDTLNDPQKRDLMIDDGVRMIDAEVGDKGGFGGLAIKAAYGMAKGIAPGIIPKLLGNMLGDFLDELQPFYDEAKQKGVDLKAYVSGRSAVVANALLAVTDRRAQKADGGPLKKGYEKLRPTAEKHVEQALPRLADLVTKHVG
jgi:hypothetical protein